MRQPRPIVVAVVAVVACLMTGAASTADGQAPDDPAGAPAPSAAPASDGEVRFGVPRQVAAFRLL